jgi:hypothetical protein
MKQDTFARFSKSGSLDSALVAAQEAQAEKKKRKKRGRFLGGAAACALSYYVLYEVFPKIKLRVHSQSSWAERLI